MPSLSDMIVNLTIVDEEDKKGEEGNSEESKESEEGNLEEGEEGVADEGEEDEDEDGDDEPVVTGEFDYSVRFSLLSIFRS